MAITTVAGVRSEPFSAVPPGNRRRVSAVLNGSSSYTTGGDTISAALFGLTTIDLILFNLPVGGIRFYTWDHVNATVKCFDLVAGVLTEEGAATDCSADRVSCTVWGI